jgi:HlyD family secretion protein
MSRPTQTQLEHPAPALTPNPGHGLPVPLPPAPQFPQPHHYRRRWLLLLALIGAGGIAYWRLHPASPPIPPGIVFGNGRLEADEIDIDTKFAGRIARLLADEGDLVHQGQTVALMDVRDLQAEFAQYRALAEQAQRALDQARATARQQQASVLFARQELTRTQALIPRGFASRETLDQQTQQLTAAEAALQASLAAEGAAQHALEAAAHQVEFVAVNIADNTLVAPKTGPIEYRVANAGEVLAAGGKVFTMLDASYVYMDVYLPTRQAGKIRIGAEARIVLDAYPDHVIPAAVVFVASQAQFTPKMVETQDEREKLMFRIRVRIDPKRLEGHEALVRSGLPGQAYIRADDTIAWPPNLTASPPLPRK